MAKKQQKLTEKNFMEFFWNLSTSVTAKEITPSTVAAACNAGRNIIKMAYLSQRQLREPLRDSLALKKEPKDNLIG